MECYAHAECSKATMALLGDFNEVLFGHEKEGGRPKSQTCMDKFREALELCGLSDLGFLEICSLGETTVIQVIDIYVRGWIEQ